MATARNGRELFTILETSADTESSAACGSQEYPLNLCADVKWFEIPYKKPESDEEDGMAEEEEEEDDEEEEEDEDADADADEDEDDGDGGGGVGENGSASKAAVAAAVASASASSLAAGGACNIILVTGSNGLKHEEEDNSEECHYSTSTNCSDAASNDSDLDFSDLEEEEEERASFLGYDEDLYEDCTSPDFWGEPDQVIAIETFSASSGPQQPLGDDAEPRDYFRILFPDSLFEHMVEQTNNYALYRQKRSGKTDPHWHPTHAREMRAYVGLNILMGINQLPESAMYWASDIFIGNAGFKKTMTARRFEKLTQYLQLCDRETEPVRGERGYDGLFKIRPLLDVLENTMWDAYTPNRCLTIDKSGLVTKGRLPPTHAMPSKPLKKGLSVWMLCDSRSGYCHRAKIHVGRPSEDRALLLQGYRVVSSLVRGLEGQHHHIYMGNSFNSVPLLLKLLKTGLYACGPTHSGRKGFPEVLRPRNVGKLSQGEFYQCQRGNLVATVTRDIKVISCLSTNSAPGIVGISPGEQHNSEMDGDGDSDSMESSGPSLGLPRPLPLLLYQENRKGVDLCDQLSQCYQVGRPCRKWWRYFLWFYVNVCIVNAYVLLRESRGGTPPAGLDDKEFTQRHFRVRLAQQLIGDYQGARGMERAARKRHADSPVEYGHRLERMSERSRRCRNCTNKGLRHESVFGCKICNVHLCRGGCFSEFHK